MSKSLNVLINPPETIIDGSPEIVEERHMVDLYMAHNGLLEVHNDIQVVVNYESADLTVITVQGRVYPVTRKKGDKLFYTRPTFSSVDAYMLPAIMVYAVFSTFLNIQLYAEPDTFITVPNFILLLLNLAVGMMWGGERAKRTTEILFLKVHFSSYISVDWTTKIHNPLIREYFTYRGYSLQHMIAMLGAGVLMSIPFALAPQLGEIDYFIAFVGVAFFLFMGFASMTSNETDAQLSFQKPKVYGLGVVEAIFSNGNRKSVENEDDAEIIGYEGIGVFVPYENGDAKARERQERRIKSKGFIAGVKPVYEVENVLESSDRNYTTIMAEAYKDRENEESYEVLDSDTARMLLDKTAKEYEDFFKDTIVTKTKKTIKGGKSEETKETVTETLKFEDKTIREILLFYDRHHRLFRNALSWLGAENKTRTEVQKADKIVIRNQQAVISSQRAVSSEIKVSTQPLDWNPLVKWGGAIVFVLLLFFLFLWMDSNNVSVF